MSWNLSFLEKYYNEYDCYDIEIFLAVNKNYTVFNFRGINYTDNNSDLKAMHFILFINCIKYQKNYFKDV